MTDRIVIGYRLSVSRWVNPSTGERGLILWERENHSDRHLALGPIGKASGHVVDVDALTVTPSILAHPWHGWLTNGKWTDA